MKVLPPWMIKQGMNLTKEQRGEVKEEVKMDGTSAPVDLSDDKKSMIGKDDTKNLQARALQKKNFLTYYAALLQRQREQDEVANGQQEPLDRQVGMKSKRDENEGDEDIEWEEDAPAGNTNESYKVNDLNVEADALGDDEDDIDWEEG
ncbi:transcription factor TFIIE, alpha subunit [Actinidia rufa]|uniref:Transcription factor TFIIE, alpha subunit n=1 Tax=Actinidia rufa TaxID=165716 RepID=A0A7J0EXS7_9ERIC|nr:transcription factor TFIIE, alpha subunit [Actinidia rufa]